MLRLGCVHSNPRCGDPVFPFLPWLFGDIPVGPSQSSRCALRPWLPGEALVQVVKASLGEGEAPCDHLATLLCHAADRGLVPKHTGALWYLYQACFGLVGRAEEVTGFNSQTRERRLGALAQMGRTAQGGGYEYWSQADRN